MSGRNCCRGAAVACSMPSKPVTNMPKAKPEISPDAQEAPSPSSRLVYRQALSTRVTHWLWAVSLFFLLMSGPDLQRASCALSRPPVRLRIRQFGPQDRHGGGGDRPRRLHGTARLPGRDDGLSRTFGRVWCAAGARLPLLGDHPFGAGSCERLRRSFLLRLAAILHASHMALDGCRQRASQA